MLMVNDFFQRSFLDKGSDTSYIALIPKKKGVVCLSDFRPISLVGSTYKIISKSLALRIKEVLPRIMSREQGAFFQGRTMMDEVLYANECVDARIREGKPGVLCKLDLEKAYDHVNWDFFMYVMGRHGFGIRWREWM